MAWIKPVKVFFSILLLLIAIYYLYQTAQGLFVSTSLKQLVISKTTFLLITFISVFAGITNAWVWYSVNKPIAKQSTFVDSYWAWSISRLFRYIPGKAATYLVRHKLQNSSKLQSIIASVNELQLTIFPILILALAYVSIMRLNVKLAILISLFLIVFLGAKKILAKFLPSNRKISDYLLSAKNIIFRSSATIPAILLHSLAFYLIIFNVADTPSVSFMYALMTLYISGIISQLTLLVPAGLVVREASIVYFLTTYGLSSENALLIAALSRASLLMSEFINVFIASLMKKVAYAPN